MKDTTKPLYDIDSKLEYDYDSSTDSDIHKFDEYDNTKAKDVINDNRNNQYFAKSYASRPKPDAINNYYYAENGQIYSSANNQDSDNVWANDNYGSIKSNSNNWPQTDDTIDPSDFTSLRAQRPSLKQSLSHPFHTLSHPFHTLSHLFGDPIVNSASAPVGFKSGSSKIYGSTSTHQSSYGPSPSQPPSYPPSYSQSYQPLSLFAGFGRDYGSVNINGDLYPAPLVNNHPPRKLYKPKNYEGNKYQNFDLAEFLNSDLVKVLISHFYNYN